MATSARQSWGEGSRDMTGRVAEDAGAATAGGPEGEASTGGPSSPVTGGWPPVVTLPEPALVVLIGAAGAGKSTLARRWFGPEEILSSDDLRAVVAGDPADQSATGAAFGILHRRLTARLRAGMTTVVDATSVRDSARRPLLRRAAAAGVPAVAIVLDLPGALVHARNAARPGRVVPTGVVDRQLDDLRRSLAAGRLHAEGFLAIHVVREPDHLDVLEIARVAMSPGAGRPAEMMPGPPAVDAVSPPRTPG